MDSITNNNQHSDKKQKKVCSCLDVIKRAFSRNQSQNSSLPLSQTTINLENKNGSNKLKKLNGGNAEGQGQITTQNNNNTNANDLSTNMFINRQQSQIFGNNQQMNQNKDLENCSNPHQQNLVLRNSQIQGNNNAQKLEEPDYIFRFLQRYDYMNKKFAPNKEIIKNKNCRQFQNFILKTILEGDEPQYCEVDCCKTPVCLECSLEIAVEYQRLMVRVPECLFCQKDMSNSYYQYRDPFKSEEKLIRRQTAKSIEQRLKEYENLKSIQKIDNNESAIFQNSPDVNRSFSAVKPMRLDFIKQQQEKLRLSRLDQSAQKDAKNLKYTSDTENPFGKSIGINNGLNHKDKISQIFEDILKSSCHSSHTKDNSPSQGFTLGSSRDEKNSSSGGQNHSSADSTTLRVGYSTQLNTSNINNQTCINNLLNHSLINAQREERDLLSETMCPSQINLNNNNTKYINSEMDISLKIIPIEDESKPQMPQFKQIGGRKRIQNRVKSGANYNSLKKSNSGETQSPNPNDQNEDLDINSDQSSSSRSLKKQPFNLLKSQAVYDNIKLNYPEDQLPISKRLRSKKVNPDLMNDENVNGMNIKGSKNGSQKRNASISGLNANQQSKRIRKL
eukprot:403337275